MLEVVVVAIVSRILLRRFKVTVAQYGTCVFFCKLMARFYNDDCVCYRLP